MVEANKKITVAGKITDPNFHKCITAARAIENKKGSGVCVDILQFFETQWEEYLRKTASQNKGVFYNHKVSPMIFCGEKEYIGDHDEFLKYALMNYSFLDDASHDSYVKIASDAFKEKINRSPSCKYSYFTFNLGGVDNQVVMELFQSIAPKTCDNFMALCRQMKNKEGEMIGYGGTEVHRIVKGMFLQMGKITLKNPESFATLYGTEFPDESFEIKHTEVGLLGMCKRNGLKHTNESQFYVTTGAPLTYMDGQNVIFGRVISGMSTIRMIEQMETMNERPTETVKIAKCGLYKE